MTKRAPTFGERRRHPPADDYDADLMKRVVQIAQAEAFAGREIAWQIAVQRAFAERRNRPKKSRN